MVRRSEKIAYMTTSSDTQIAGSKTIADWQSFRQRLVSNGGQSLWEEAFREYFHPRLSLRYLNPIKVIREHGTFQGEGFSIVALQCSLVEYLESTAQGISYHFLRKGETLGSFEYARSKQLFVAFLSGRHPFTNAFASQDVAEDFYEGVRCGLLHEARTKKGWKIWGKSPNGMAVDSVQKIVYRNNFQDALLDFIDWYKGALLTEVHLQEAFIRKFDSLCQ